jgi:hypothetical protein
MERAGARDASRAWRRPAAAPRFIDMAAEHRDHLVAACHRQAARREMFWMSVTSNTSPGSLPAFQVSDRQGHVASFRFDVGADAPAQRR